MTHHLFSSVLGGQVFLYKQCMLAMCICWLRHEGMELSTASLSSVITVPSLTSTALPYHHEHYVCHYHSYQPLFYLNSPPSPSSSPPTHCCRSRCAIAGDLWAHVHETCPSTPRKLWWGTYTAPRIRTHVFATVGSNFHSIIECHLNGCGCDLVMDTMCSECPWIRMYIHMYVSALWAAQVIMYLQAPPPPAPPWPRPPDHLAQPHRRTVLPPVGLLHVHTSPCR